MDADALLASELYRRGVAKVGELSDDEIVELGLRYAIWLPVQTHVETPWLAPFAVRRIRIRTDVNAPGPARDLWGFPDAHGHFTDDNSLIKGVVRGRSALGMRSPYGDLKLSTGMVCCHVWAGTTADPLLFSFVPNLVWLPRTLAGYSDAHFRARSPHQLHFALRAASSARFRSSVPMVSQARVEHAWQGLDHEHDFLAEVADPEYTELSGGRAISTAATTRTKRVLQFLDEVSAGGRPARRVSRRYHAGVGARIDTGVPAVQEFVELDRLSDLSGTLRDLVVQQ